MGLDLQRGESGNDMRTESAIIILKTMTPTRVGAGQSAGLIDQPIMRLASTNWPVIPGTSLKGVLKAAHVDSWLDDNKSGYDRVSDAVADLGGIYGSDNSSDPYMGSLRLRDLLPLLFPVKSLYGVFGYVTCPMALEELSDAAASIGITLRLPTFSIGTNPDRPKALTPRGSQVIQGTEIILDEFDFIGEINDQATQLAALLAPIVKIDLQKLSQRLVVVSDEMFTFITQMCTEVRTRTALEYASKSVRGGSLRT